MNKKQRKNIIDLVQLIMIIITFLIVFASKIGWIYYFISLIGSVIVTQIIGLFIPIKQPQKRTSPNRTTTKVSKSIPKNRLLSDGEILKLPIKKLSWRELERLCYLFYKAKGFRPEETSQGADGGVDLIYFDPKYNERVAVQIKHYINSNNQISVEKIRELHASKRNHNCMLAEFITTSRFSNDALVDADKYKIETKDICWFEREVIPWMKKEEKKNKVIS